MIFTGFFAAFGLAKGMTVEAAESCSNIRQLNQGELEYCLTESQNKVQGYKTEYAVIAEETADYRALVSANENLMRSLSSSAEAERIKERMITRILKSFLLGE